MDFNIKPLGNRVLVKYSDKVAKSHGGIIIPATAQEKPMTGTVISVGNDPSLTVKEGDLVMFSKNSGTKIDDEHMMFIEPILVAVLTKKSK